VPQWLWGLFLIPLLIALFVRSERRGLKRLQEFVSGAATGRQLAGNGESAPADDKDCAAAAGPLRWAIVSLAQPRGGLHGEDVNRRDSILMQ